MRKNKWSDTDVIDFCEPLSELLQGGMSLLDSLSFLYLHANKKKKHRLKLISDRLRNGNSFSRALMEAGAPALFISIIVCSEENNEFVHALKNVSNHFEQRLMWQRKWQQIIIYPMFIIFSIIVCFLFLLIVVLPHFYGMYETLDVQLPPSLLMLVHLGEWLRHYGMISFGFVMFTIFSLSLIYIKLESFQTRVTYFLLRIPYVNSLIRLYYTELIAFQMGFLLSSKLNILHIFNLLEQYSSSVVMKRQMKKIVDKLMLGEKLGHCMNDYIFRSDFSTVIETGENSGNVAGMISTYAFSLKSMQQRKMQMTMKIIEPSLIVSIGMFIGIIVIILFLPIFSMINEL